LRKSAVRGERKKTGQSTSFTYWIQFKNKPMT